MDASVFAPKSHQQQQDDLERSRGSRSHPDDLDPHRIRSGSNPDRSVVVDMPTYGGASTGQQSMGLDYTGRSTGLGTRGLRTGSSSGVPDSRYLSDPTQTSLSTRSQGRQRDTLGTNAWVNPAYAQTPAESNSHLHLSGTGGGGGYSNGHLHNRPRGANEDELEIVNNVMQPGNTSAPLVASIREELQRLGSASAPKMDSIHSFSESHA